MDTRLPPIAQLGAATLALSVIAAILITSNIPSDPPWAIVLPLLVAAALSLLVAVVLLVRIPDFAWGTFFLVAKWSLLGYIVIAGMIEFAFIHNNTPGPTLAAMSAMLALFAVDVPLLLGFSVARYADPDEPLSGRTSAPVT
jgi:hypothetical protein